MSENIFYVYLHRCKLDNSVFYVGKGKGLRAWTAGNRSKQWQLRASQHGYIVEIHTEELSEVEALELERKIIATYGRASLMNKTSGGQGMSGLRHTEESLAKMSLAHTGHKVSEETKLKLSIYNKGIKRSPETVEKVRQANLGLKRSEDFRRKCRRSVGAELYQRLLSKSLERLSKQTLTR